MLQRSALALAATAILACGTARADVSVVASIKPIHSLVASVMEGAGTPKLLMEGGTSPHTYSMRPSTARTLAGADVVFWAGPAIESFMVQPLKTLAADAKVVTLIDTPDLEFLPQREGGAFDAHDHDHGHDHHDGEEHAAHEEDDDHDAHEDHAREDHDAHEDGEEDHAAHDDEGHEDHEEHAAHEEHEEHEEHAVHEAHEDHEEHAAHDDHEEHADAGHDDHDHHEHGVNPHVWLDPANARVMVKAIAETLAAADPDNAALYAANAERAADDLAALETEMAGILAPVRDVPFIVFHDAYPYLEERFGLQAVGSITVSPEIMPGAAQLGEIREKVETLGAKCVFSEPQFQSRIVDVIIEGTSAGTGVLDPIGSDTPAGPGQYATFMLTNAEALRACLGES